jgi:hypothetical protein
MHVQFIDAWFECVCKQLSLVARSTTKANPCDRTEFTTTTAARGHMVGTLALEARTHFPIDFWQLATPGVETAPRRMSKAVPWLSKPIIRIQLSDDTRPEVTFIGRRYF